MRRLCTKIHPILLNRTKVKATFTCPDHPWRDITVSMELDRDKVALDDEYHLFTMDEANKIVEKALREPRYIGADLNSIMGFDRDNRIQIDIGEFPR